MENGDGCGLSASKNASLLTIESDRILQNVTEAQARLWRNLGVADVPLVK